MLWPIVWILLVLALLILPALATLWAFIKFRGAINEFSSGLDFLSASTQPEGTSAPLKLRAPGVTLESQSLREARVQREQVRQVRRHRKKARLDAAQSRWLAAGLIDEQIRYVC